jgi:hypothetical protein
MYTFIISYIKLDIAEIQLKLAFNTNQSINLNVQSCRYSNIEYFKHKSILTVVKYPILYGQ